MGILSTLKEVPQKIQGLNLYKFIIGFFVGIISFLSGLLWLSERSKEKAQKRVKELEIKDVVDDWEDKIEHEPLSEIISRHDAEYKRRRGR